MLKSWGCDGSQLTYAQTMGMRRNKPGGNQSQPRTKLHPLIRRPRSSGYRNCGEARNPRQKKRREWKGERRWCSGESFSTFSCLLPSVPPPVQWGRVVVRGHRKQPPFSSSSTLLFPRRRSPP